MVFYFGALLVSLALTQFTDAATVYIEADVDDRIFIPSAVRAGLGDVIDIQSRGALEWGFVEAVGYNTPCTESQRPRIRHLNATSGTEACPSRLTRARFVVQDTSTPYIVFGLGRCQDGMVLAVNLLPDQSPDTLQINARAASEDVSSTDSCASPVPSTVNSFDVSSDTLSTPTPAESTTTFNLRLAFAISIPVLVAIAAGIWFYTDYRRKRRRGRPYMRQQDTEQYSFPLPPLEEAPIYTRTDESAALSATRTGTTSAPLTSSSGASEYPPRPQVPGASSKWAGGEPGSNIDVEVPLKQDAVVQHNRPESRTTIGSLPSYRS